MSYNRTISPNLATIKMVEKAIVEYGDDIHNLSQLKKMLPKQVNHYALKEIIKYLEESNKIMFTSQGMIWLQEYKRDGIDYSDIKKRYANDNIN